MNTLIHHIQSKLSISLVTFFSTLFLSAGRIESNPQDCEMISIEVKKKREEPVDGHKDSLQAEQN